MTEDQQTRLAVLELAVKTPGNPNTLQLAQQYLEFVNCNKPAPAAYAGSKKK